MVVALLSAPNNKKGKVGEEGYLEVIFVFEVSGDEDDVFA
jgi:hypothetical protein